MLQRVLELDPGQCVIATSGYSTERRAADVIELGAWSFLRKPFTFEELGEAVRAGLERRR